MLIQRAIIFIAFYQYLYRLYSITTNSPTQGLQNISYTYDNGGNITEITDLMDANRTQNFAYDHLNRLTQAQSLAYGTLTYQYNYNEIGNMMYNSQVGTYTYGAKPHAVIQAGANTYQYDANGNMTQRPNQTITYDYDNRPTSINSTTFIYDYSGQRVKKNNTIYIGKLYECTAGNCTKYIFAGSSRIASKTSSNTYYYHTDHLGSSSIITDNAGNKVEEIYYYPFGGTRLNQGSVNLKHKYTGQEEDPETGLYFYNARYYDPILGRFISADSIVQDPFDPQAFNRYSYTRNNPLIYTDPTGNWYMDLYSYSGGGGGCYWCNYDPWAGSYRRQQEAYWDYVASSSSSSSSSSKSSSTSTSTSSSTPAPTPTPAPAPASSTQIFTSAIYNTMMYLPRTAEYFNERIKNVRWDKFADPATGLIGNGLGIAVGTVLLGTPEATGVTKVVGGVVLTKSLTGWGLSWYNLTRSLSSSDHYDAPSSATRALAVVIAPENRNARLLADAADLSIDLAAGRGWYYPYKRGGIIKYFDSTKRTFTIPEKETADKRNCFGSLIRLAASCIAWLCYWTIFSIGTAPLKDRDRSSGALEKEIMKHRCFKGIAGDESVKELRRWGLIDFIMRAYIEEMDNVIV